MLKAIKSFSDSYMSNKHCQEVYAKAKIAEPYITNDMLNIASSLGNTMADLAYAIKEASHVEWKLEKNTKSFSNRTIEQEMDIINDLVRYTQICPHEKIAETTKKTLDLLKDKGYQVYSLDNKFVHPHKKTGYRGMHILAFSPCGQKIELQIHSPISFEAKNKGHEIYKQVSLNRISEEEKEKAIAEAKRIHGSFDNPPNINSIKGIMPPGNIAKYQSDLQFPHKCILSYCSSSPELLGIDGQIEDQSGNIISSYSELTNYKEKDTIAVYNDNNGTKLFVSNPEKLEGMIDDAVSSCDLSLLSELESCRDFINGTPEFETIERTEQNLEIEI